jgi:hypothetical protein
VPAKSVSLFAFVFMLTCCRLYGQAQASHIRGQVIGEQQRPLASATVTLVDTLKREVIKTSTGDKGQFDIAYARKGNYFLVISHTGFKEYRSERFELADKNFDVIQLILVATTLGEVAVQSKQGIVELQGNTLVFNVAKSINAQGMNAFEVLQKAPGVYIENETVISLNGKQGALILLDGKQTYLSGKELVDLLKSMPSSGIKSIEIISSPGAKYDAAGSAGIINIKTNKLQIPGFNGTATTGISYGMNLRQNQDISFNYRKSKINVYGSYNHFVGYYSYLYGSDRLQNNKAYYSATDDTDKRNKLGSRLGVDYDISKEQTVGILLTGNFVFGGGFTRTKTNIGAPSSAIVEQVLDADNDYYFQKTSRYNANFNYKYENALGKIINVDADYGYFRKGNANLQSNIYSKNQSVTSSNLYRTLNDIDINLKALKFDYTTKLAKGIFETGAKYSNVNAANDSKFFHAITNGDSLDERRSNSFRFEEQIISGYLNYKKSVGKWSFQAGVRLENSSSLGALFFRHKGVDSTENISRNYTNLFPSLSVSVKPKDNHSFSLSYSRRIDRPAYQDLNPFVYLLDELSFWQGNPFLQPQLTHRIALLYAYKSSTVVGLAFSHTDQFSTRITDTLEATKIVMIQRNLGVQNNAALSLTQNVSPAKWWDITFNGTLYHLHNKISFDKYRNFDLKQLAARINLQQVFKLPYKFTGEMTAAYNSKRLSGANDISRHTSGIDLGIQRKLMKDKATLRLVFQDIYRGNQSNSLQAYNDFYLRSYGYYESRQVRVNFTYRFADNTVKGPRTRNSALESESGRIK